MCGIIGVVGLKEAVPFLMEGLRRLKYRGYDSAGIATLEKGEFHRVRAEGKLEFLEAKLETCHVPGTLGIGHTRWATHGLPVERNAHPHSNGKVALVHNGIIENFVELYQELTGKGVVFETETDTEVVVHLLTYYLLSGKTPQEAMKETLGRLKGAFALAVIFKDFPNLLIGARQGPPLVVGYKDNEMFLASDALALSPFTQKISYLEDGDWVVLTPSQATFYDQQGTEITRPVHTTALSGELIGKGKYRHFMEKEIHEQPLVISDTLQSYVQPLTQSIGLPPFPENGSMIERIVIIACGTSYYAGMIGKYWLESLTGLPVDVDIASEYRYRDSPISSKTLCLFISQSGETADTLAALNDAKSKGALIVSIVNVPESSIDRASDITLLTHAGPEIGVASTKAFSCQLTVLACFSVGFAKMRGAISKMQEQKHIQDLLLLPGLITKILEVEESIKKICPELAQARDVLFLGRNLLYPIALEGALKLKELSYIHAEGYAGGELKHGPIALIDDQMPVVVLASSGLFLDKTVSNIQEIMARSAKVIALGDVDALEKIGKSLHAKVVLPDVPSWIVPIVYTIPVQLLAYHTAVLKGTDVDQPRNLAKSVTVE
ncbi:MAG: glutamine--fructose-6-phosphate transaminase (isomerizing) [Alphaproteobacteria bacterium 16-39-46]|nr:MAG: glutamine--fructose-6-phosphate transaminase (isomerizing) [Alphaproteobacteria bacterium 16-39-46]OZA43655.1 MAG: glutamine--fructose-6-phosphate transaminase (isomerizing) [Alphaproteobacteria bacterium 17-39-52]HQS83747.1 glutamine--fructose-6-phosphate transaminase (isomerizing) [Alphaproteobacteria bacterium]HQS93494.1 glutamine--fructose-6-phosphate transaminase (isomerizing) [Alphaproteobacteria bacterium]